jgi:GTP-binding protein
MSTKEYETKIKQELEPFTDVTILFVSALTKQRLPKALEETVKVFENRKQRIPTSKFNDYMLKVIENSPPPALKGKYVKIKYCMQLPTPTPQFVFFANLPQYVKDAYKRFLENKIREHWDFSGVPIDIYIREK